MLLIFCLYCLNLFLCSSLQFLYAVLILLLCIQIPHFFPRKIMLIAFKLPLVLLPPLLCCVPLLLKRHSLWYHLRMNLLQICQIFTKCIMFHSHILLSAIFGCIIFSNLFLYLLCYLLCILYHFRIKNFTAFCRQVKLHYIKRTFLPSECVLSSHACLFVPVVFVVDIFIYHHATHNLIHNRLFLHINIFSWNIMHL